MQDHWFEEVFIDLSYNSFLLQNFDMYCPYRLTPNTVSWTVFEKRPFECELIEHRYILYCLLSL